MRVVLSDLSPLYGVVLLLVSPSGEPKTTSFCFVFLASVVLLV